MVAAPESREVGLVGAVSMGIGGMVGGGIFAVLGVAAVEAGPATPVAFALAGLVAALTAYSYAALSTHFRSAGGTATFVDRVFGIRDLTGGLNVVLWAGYIATTALYVSAFANYGGTLMGGGGLPSPGLRAGLVLVGVGIPWAINLADASLVARSEGVVVAVKLAILAVVIGAGFPSVDWTRLVPAAPSPPGTAVFAAGMLIFVAYEGFELIANASADVVRPERTLPWAFGLAVGIVVVLYVAIATVVVGALTPAEIAGSADVALARAAGATLGPVGFTLVAVSAVLATFSATNATLYGAARLSFTLASEGELPRAFEATTWRQPVGLHATALLGFALAVLLPLTSLSTVCSAVFLAVFAVVNGAAFKVAPTIGARRWLAGLGVVGCSASLATLLVRSARDDLPGLVVLAVLVTAALLVERVVLRPATRRTG